MYCGLKYNSSFVEMHLFSDEELLKVNCKGLVSSVGIGYIERKNEV